MPDFVKENAGDILKEYLLTHGIKQNYVAKEIGMTASQFNYRITGRAKFDMEFALAVAKVLYISPTVFLSKNYSKWITCKHEKLGA